MAVRVMRYTHLSGYSSIFLERKHVLIIGKERRINIYGAGDFNRIKTIAVSHPSGFCTDPEENFLFCFTTTGELFVFETQTWECIQQRKFLFPKKKDESLMAGELETIYYLNQRFLIGVSLTGRDLFLIESDSGTCEWLATVEEGDFGLAYSWEKNMLKCAYTDCDEPLELWKFPIRRKTKTLTSKRYGSLCELELIGLHRGIDFFEMEKEWAFAFRSGKKKEGVLRRKRQNYLDWYDGKSGEIRTIETREPFRKSFVSDSGVRVIEKRQRVFFPLRDGVMIVNCSGEKFGIEKLIPMKQTLTQIMPLSEERVLILGWEYGIVVELGV